MNSALAVARVRFLRGRRVFLVLGFASFAGAFSLRVVRDTVLITATFAPTALAASRFGLHSGADILPISFVANAVLMTFFATRLGVWLQRFPAELVTRSAFFVVAAASVLCAIVLPFLHNPWIFLFFYILSEMPIFLFMNMVWILAGPWFTELEQRAFFPKITGCAYLGAFTPAATMLVLTQLEFSGVYILLALAALAAVAIALCASELRRRFFVKEAEAPTGEIDEGGVAELAKPRLVEEIRWSLGERYLAYFVLVTIANFALLAIFDQTMASAAGALGMEPKALLIRLLFATCGFAIVSAVIQFFFFRRMLDAFGAAKLNLFPPLFMLLGCLIYIVFGTNWITGSAANAPEFFTAALFARVCGWFAEFLFNQALLPYHYGALPTRDENRARLLVEGPITALTNGAVGVLLAAYVIVFAIRSEVRFDLLFVIALVLAVLMLVGSVLMIPQYRVVLLKRLRVGDPLDHLDVASRRFLAPVFAARRFPEAGRTAPSAGDAALARVLAESDQAGFLAALPPAENVPPVGRIGAIIRTADRLGVLAQLEERLAAWLRAADGPEFVAAAQGLCALGFDGAAAVRDEVERRRQSGHQRISDSDRIALAVMLRSESLLADALDTVWSRPSLTDEIDIVSLAEHPIARPQLVLGAFLLVAARLATDTGPILAAARRMIERNPWLRFVLLRILRCRRAETPIMFRGCRHVAPLLLTMPVSSTSEARDSELFKAAVATWRESLATQAEMGEIGEFLKGAGTRGLGLKPLDDELAGLALAYSESGDEPGVFTSLLTVLLERRSLGIGTPPADLAPLLAGWRRAAAQQPGARIPRPWRRMRAIQVTNSRLQLQALETAEVLAAWEAPTGVLAAQLVDGQAPRDRTLAMLEQTVPRASYRVLHNDLDLALNTFDAPHSAEGLDAILGSAMQWANEGPP